MRSRKVSDIEKVLLRKGFEKKKGKDHHSHYFLHIDGKRTHIYTYLSHGAKSSDYNKNLMTKVKNQLKFKDNKTAEDFFDCPLTLEQYLDMLKTSGDL